MKTFLRVLTALPGILFVVMGLRWLVDPSGAAAGLGMTLMEGVGLSSQIGDLGSFFLSIGIMMLTALVTANRNWFYAPALLLMLTALFRLVAWLLHDAALAVPMIIVEIVLASILLFASSRLSNEA